MINWKNSLENLILIFGTILMLGLYTKLFLEPIVENTIKEAVNKETTAITQTVTQEIDNKFKVYKGGQVDATVSPVADPTQENTVNQARDTTNCVDISGLSSIRQNKIKRWLRD